MAVAAACAATILTAGAAMADAASPLAPGDPVGAPSGAVRNVFIEHEDLTMDLSSMNVAYVSGAAPHAAVVATYSLRNDGAAAGIDLVFVTASQDVSSVQVALDGQAVVAKQGPLGPVPGTWMPPTGTPGLHGGPDVPYGVDRPAGLTFRIDLGAGRHTMTTSYRAVPTMFSGDALAYEPHYWQLAFVLSPARQWEGFGDLALTVRVPSGWPASVRPVLTRRGDELSGHFSGIPADSIGVTTRFPIPPDATRNPWIAGLAVAAIVSLLAGLLLALPRWWPLLVGVAPFAAFVPAFMISTAVQMRHDAIPLGQGSWSGAKGVPFDAFWWGLVACFAGVIVGQVALGVGIGGRAAWHRMARRKPH